MSIIESRLKTMGLSLPEAKHPVGNYLGTKKVGDLLFVSARVSDCVGEVGTEVSEEKATQAAHDTVLNLLAIIKKDIHNLDLIQGVVKLQGFIRSSATFTKQPQVLNGASNLLIELFGEAGKHARTATGVNQLPFGASVQIDMVLQLHN